MTLGTTWPYYLTVLYYRVPTPLLLLALAGLARALLPGGSPLVRWSAVALISGMAILMVMPYRTDRYLMPGIGLVVPSIVLASSWHPRLKKSLCWVLLGFGLLYQVGWLHPYLGIDLRHLPLALATPPLPGIGGNDRPAMEQALKMMRPPSWHFNLSSAPPKPYGPPLVELAQRMQKQAGTGCPVFALIDNNRYFSDLDLEDEYLALEPNTGSQIKLTDLKQGGLLRRAQELMPQWDQSLGWPQNFLIIRLILSPQERLGGTAISEQLSAAGFQPFFSIQRRPGLDHGLQGWRPTEANGSYHCGPAASDDGRAH